MGLFSWLTADTQESIPCVHSNRPTFTVHMITEDGQIFTEKAYEGYGVFGGKDFYILAAEINTFKGKDDAETRMNFFNCMWKRGVETKDGKTKLFYRDDFDNYESKITVGNLKTTANELVSKHGWQQFDYERDGFQNHGFKMPKIVEVLPSKENWKAEWDELPYNKLCPNQGYFYGDDSSDWVHQTNEDGSDYIDEDED